ncbi:glycosyltransferase family 2 protein [uncultured Sulfitobacter sp.]|uniref:glycosyltransferase family 2 protein n=2 Tax=uncultured Sulfitobacter sp. TaxID=191468 RepID=UPI002599C3EB|nr:glycosyltransferase family 2 protein [uncultured Sulfitobacter sp.]
MATRLFAEKSGAQVNGKVIRRKMAGCHFDAFSLLDAVLQDVGDAQHVTLYFDTSVSPDAVVPPQGATRLSAVSVAGASVFSYALPLGVDPIFDIAGQKDVAVVCSSAETSTFEKANALAAVRNGEDAAIVADWLAHHAKYHRMTAAVIVDRSMPDKADKFATELHAGITARKLDCTVVILTSDIPLGKPGTPAEAHPFNVPEAPGKDRMKVPPSNPWSSPLGVMSIYEIIRARFLRSARAVANIDVHDLIPPTKPTVFDTAVDAENGLIELIGQHCYPWRVRNNDSATFADHTCVQFDTTSGRRRWCIAPASAPKGAIWRLVRVGNASPDLGRTIPFFRYMALRHPTTSISKIVPKTSLVEHPPLLEQSVNLWGHDPVRMPEVEIEDIPNKRGRCAIVTTMKNEGPFILEWIAYHRAIGFDDFIVYTNDCTDGTDTMLALLQDKGIVQHRENPYREMNLKPQHAALQAAEEEDIIKNASWVTCIDVDEFVNIKCGDGTLDALFAEIKDANMIAMTWRLFGNSDVHLFDPTPITAQFQRCAPEHIRKPHQAWGFKTLFRNMGIFKKLGVHRPKGLKSQLWKEIKWVNGSGKPLPRDMYRNGWRSTADTYGYDLVQLNHYAVRSAESFLVKRDRGRVNHVDRDQGLAYWFRMNNNAETEQSIQSRLPRMKEVLAQFMEDADIAAAHNHSVACHRRKITELRATENYSKFYAELTSPRMEKLSTLHAHFGANVFLQGPGTVPDEVVARAQDGDWVFTVEREEETQH